MPKYDNLSEELQERIREDRKKHWVNPFAFRDEDVVRRKMNHDRANLWRPAFVRDSEKIMHIPYYNRYADKTRVFPYIRTTIFRADPSKFSWCRGLPEISEAFLV